MILEVPDLSRSHKRAALLATSELGYFFASYHTLKFTVVILVINLLQHVTRVFSVQVMHKGRLLRQRRDMPHISTIRLVARPHQLGELLVLASAAKFVVVRRRSLCMHNPEKLIFTKPPL